ncbi:MAG: IS110 family transposase [Acidobacteriaceae bacterium]|nr:IS110 family transposase [Acidobacteriaceae bacterium]
MAVVYPRCCGLDVHKESVVACVMVSHDQGTSVRKRTFGTFTKDLHRLRLWLHACKVTHVAMESTGVYWKPVWNILEPHFQLVLLNPAWVKAQAGHKTDQKDSERIADLLQQNKVKPSFVPPVWVRQLRDLVRYRLKLQQENSRVRNRIQKLLEDANLKLGVVVSDCFGLTGRSILRDLRQGRTEAAFLAEYARGSLRLHKQELKLALQGYFTDHHRFLLDRLLAHLEFLEAQVSQLESEIRSRLTEHVAVLALLCTIPGVDEITAWTIVAELGADSTPFEDADHLASWAGLCPGNNESAGKRKHSHTCKANPCLRRALTESAWASSHTKESYLNGLFVRLRARLGQKAAIVAVAHQIVRIIYCMLRDQVPYRELGASYFDLLHRERTVKRLTKRLASMGLAVTLQPLPSPPRPDSPTPPSKGRPRKCVPNLYATNTTT